MDIKRTIEILEHLASGRSPKTGQLINNESVLNERDVIRALQIAIDQIKVTNPNIITNNKTERKDLYKEIDFFQKEKFNKLTNEDLNRLKNKIIKLGILKTENLAEYVITARKTYPRAYEEWSEIEKELLIEALKYTNDLDLLSEYFQRGKGSIESYGKKIIFESLNNKPH